MDILPWHQSYTSNGFALRCDGKRSSWLHL
jgi:hypothetical protein